MDLQTGCIWEINVCKTGGGRGGGAGGPWLIETAAGPTPTR